MVPEATDPLVVLAEQYIDDVARAEALSGPVHAGESLACGFSRVPSLWRHETVVAVAAWSGAFLAEVREQGLAPARGQLAQAEHRVELAHLDPLALFAGLGPFDHLAQGDDVGESVRHPGIGRRSVATGPARLLVVRLDAFREIEMSDEAHIGLVDPHAERDGGDDDHRVLAHERILVELALLGAHACVVGEGIVFPAAEPSRGLLDLAA